MRKEDFMQKRLERLWQKCRRTGVLMVVSADWVIALGVIFLGTLFFGYRMRKMDDGNGREIRRKP